MTRTDAAYQSFDKIYEQFGSPHKETSISKKEGATYDNKKRIVLAESKKRKTSIARGRGIGFCSTANMLEKYLAKNSADDIMTKAAYNKFLRTAAKEGNLENAYHVLHKRNANEGEYVNSFTINQVAKALETYRKSKSHKQDHLIGDIAKEIQKARNKYEISKGIESKFSGTAVIVGLVGAALTLGYNITGNVVGQGITKNNFLNPISLVFLTIGLAGIFIWFRK